MATAFSGTKKKTFAICIVRCVNGQSTENYREKLLKNRLAEAQLNRGLSIDSNENPYTFI